MAYFTQEMKKNLVPACKKVLNKYGMKATFSVKDRHSFNVTIKSGPLFANLNEQEKQVNYFHIEKNYEGKEKDFLIELRDAMNIGNHDNSDAMTDYFDVGWYINIMIGSWTKSYQYIENND